MTTIKIGRLIPALLLIASLHGCGSGDSATAVINGQAVQLEVTSKDCVAGPPSGIAGSDGVMNAPIVCNIFFRSAGYFSDLLSITVADVRPIYEQLGYWEVFGGGLVDGYLTLQGQPQPIFPGGSQVRFSEISNVAGNRVCAEYQIVTGDSQVEGAFCAPVRVGF